MIVAVSDLPAPPPITDQSLCKSVPIPATPGLTVTYGYNNCIIPVPVLCTVLISIICSHKDSESEVTRKEIVWALILFFILQLPTQLIRQTFVQNSIQRTEISASTVNIYGLRWTPSRLAAVAPTSLIRDTNVLILLGDTLPASVLGAFSRRGSISVKGRRSL